METGFVPFSPLAKGFLTGKIDDTTSFDSSDSEAPYRGLHRISQSESGLWWDLVQTLVQQNKATPSQIALAWATRPRKSWIVPIPGTTRLHRLQENLGAIDAELTNDDLREIKSAASKITVQQARYPEQMPGL